MVEKPISWQEDLIITRYKEPLGDATEGYSFKKGVV